MFRCERDDCINKFPATLTEIIDLEDEAIAAGHNIIMCPQCRAASSEEGPL